MLFLVRCKIQVILWLLMRRKIPSLIFDIGEYSMVHALKKSNMLPQILPSFLRNSLLRMGQEETEYQNKNLQKQDENSTRSHSGFF